MRAATYRIAPAAGDKASAECGVYFFGTGQGGTIDANLERWKGQFKDSNGKVAPAQIAKRTVHGLTITTIDTAGEDSGNGWSDGRRILSRPGLSAARAPSSPRPAETSSSS